MFTTGFPSSMSQQAHRVFLATRVARPSFASSRFMALQVLKAPSWTHGLSP